MLLGDVNILTYTTITKAVMADEGVDAVVVVMGAVNWVPGGDVSRLFREIKREFPHKTLLAANPLGDREIYQRMARGFHALGIPNYASVERAITALAATWRYQQYRNRATSA